MRAAKNARLALVEFSDYQCPFCARHVQQTKPQIVKEYVDTGKLKYVLRDLPIVSLHPGAPKAHEAAHCAGEQGKYWPMHDLLFGNIRAQGSQELAAHARSLGLDMKRFEQCVGSDKHAARVRESPARSRGRALRPGSRGRRCARTGPARATRCTGAGSRAGPWREGGPGTRGRCLRGAGRA